VRIPNNPPPDLAGHTQPALNASTSGTRHLGIDRHHHAAKKFAVMASDALRVRSPIRKPPRPDLDLNAKHIR
jgi:hypothetical protein